MEQGLARLNVQRGLQKPSIEYLLSLLSTDAFDYIEALGLDVREGFDCPAIVQDYETFKDVIYRYHARYELIFYGADHNLLTNKEFARIRAYSFAEEHLAGRRRSLVDHERNARSGYNGGMRKILDDLTQSLVKFHQDQYVHAIFFDLIGPNDYPTMQRLAKAFVEKCAQFFPEIALIPTPFIATDLERYVGIFAGHLREMQRLVRG